MEQNQSGFDRTQLRDVQSWRRSRSDRMVAGVCGGMARALNVDPVLVRVVMAVLVIIGPGILFYIAGWILMPDEGSNKRAGRGPARQPGPPGPPVAVAGRARRLRVPRDRGDVVVQLRQADPRPDRRARPALPVRLPPQAEERQLALVPPGPVDARPPAGPHAPAAGTPYAPNQQTTQYVGQQAPQNGPPPPPAGTSSSATRRPQDRTVESVQPVWTEDDPLGLYVDEPPAGYAPAPTRPAEPPVKGLRGVKPAVVALTGLAIAIAWLAGSSTPTMLAIGVATLGAGMLIGGFLGRTMALLPLGILLALGVAASTIFPSVPRDFKDVNVVSTAGPADHRDQQQLHVRRGVGARRHDQDQVRPGRARDDQGRRR